MEFELIVKNEGTSLVMKPNTDGDRLLLATIAKNQPTELGVPVTLEATVIVEFTSDRHPYKKPVKLTVML